MPGYYIANIIATVLVLIIWGVIFYRRSEKSLLKWFLLFFIIQLPVSFLVVYYIRIPLTEWYSGFAEHGSRFWFILKSFEATLTEEPAKILPILFFWPFIKQWFGEKKNALFAGLFLGLGFGIGEIWTVAHLYIESRPELLRMPWYVFQTGIFERFMVSFMHGAFTALFAYGLSRGFKNGFKYILLALSGHFLLNFPILIPYLFGFYSRLQENLSYSVIWSSVIAIYIFVFFFITMEKVWKYIFEKKITLNRFFGNIKCKTCNHVFELSFWRTWWFGIATLLRCPKCYKWHFYRYRPLVIWRSRQKI